MLNEFRQDPVSGDWVLFSSKRADRPGAKDTEKEFYQPKEKCPFEGDFKNQEATMLMLNHGQPVDLNSPEWTVRVVKNKFPLVMDGLCGPTRREEVFEVGAGVGAHELVITKDHERHLADLTESEIEEVVLAYFQRFTELAKDDCAAYISLFHNQGHLAGASVYHSHSQIVSLPVVPSLIVRSILRVQDYFMQTNRRIYDALLDFEIKGNRVIFENESFLVFCPFASRTPFEIRIFPKTHQSSFLNISRSEITQLAQALSTALKKLNKARNNPDYIFFLRTAPLKEQNADYRWHIEILPRESIIGGIELGSDVFVNSQDPDEAAKILRETQI